MDTAPATSILAKSNTLSSFSWYSKVQVPHWTSFCYMLTNEHKNGKPLIDAAEGVLQMYIKFIEKRHKQAIKRFHRNQKDVGIAVANKVRKQGHHYSTLHCPT